jgi:DNA-binding LacI/PurR family transcriptional regulator
VPALTTIDQQLREGARIMVDLLMRRIAGEEAASVRIEPRLLLRQST